MIYTVTLNPAVDYVMQVSSLRHGGVNRAESAQIQFGGKGINVSLVLCELGVMSKALGFTAGFTGEAIEKGVAARGVQTGFIRLESGFSRINVKIKSGGETELNANGPDIPDDAAQKLLDGFDDLRDGDTVILAGSIPPSLPENIYESILEKLEGKNVMAAVDTSGRALTSTLKYRPFLIKPNLPELCALYDAAPENTDEVIDLASRLCDAGAQNVLVSMAEKGAVLIGGDGHTYICGSYSGSVKNSVGAGDSMVAGFIAGYDKGGIEYALKLGTAAGAATAFSEGLATKSEIERLMSRPAAITVI